MFLSKLRTGGAALLTLVVTAGLVAGGGLGTPPEPPVEQRKEVVGDLGTVAGKPAIGDVDLAKLQGVWDGEAQLVVEGGAVTPNHWGRCVVNGEVMWLISAEEHYALRYQVRLNSARNPKWIDLETDGCSWVVADRVPGAVKPGIYRVTADGWELTMPTGRGKFRPADFGTDAQSQVVAIHFRKAKTIPTAAQADARRELVGRWAVTRQAYPRDDRTGMVESRFGVVEITPEYLFIQRPCDGEGKHFVWESARYSLNPAKDPRWIDLEFGGKRDADPDGFGVYELSGETLRISYRVGVPWRLRTLEFKAGIEDPLPAANGGMDRPEGRKPACALLELRRMGT